MQNLKILIVSLSCLLSCISCKKEKPADIISKPTISDIELRTEYLRETVNCYHQHGIRQIDLDQDGQDDIAFRGYFSEMFIGHNYRSNTDFWLKPLHQNVEFHAKEHIDFICEDSSYIDMYSCVVTGYTQDSSRLSCFGQDTVFYPIIEHGAVKKLFLKNFDFIAIPDSIILHEETSGSYDCTSQRVRDDRRVFPLNSSRASGYFIIRLIPKNEVYAIMIKVLGVDKYSVEYSIKLDP